MKVRELFNQCDAHKIYCFLKNEHNLGSFSEREFNRRLKILLANTEEPTENYYLVYTPYVCTCASRSERDLFLVVPDEVKKCVEKNRSPFDTIMLCDRIECNSTKISNVLNAEVCPLSTTTFYLYEICSEIFFLLAISIADVERYTKQQVLAFIQNIKDTLTYDDVPKKYRIDDKTRRICRDVESTMKQNTMFYYPYYVSVANCVTV